MTKIRVLIFLSTIIIVGSLATFIFYFARGYSFDIKSFSFTPNGLLVAKSDPDSAQIFINEELETATNATIRLRPGTYDVAIRKEGYLPWYKRIVIEKEIVTEVNAHLFRAVPSLSAVTFSGVVKPVASSDFTKIIYATLPVNSENKEKAGLWLIETVNFPFGFTKDPRRLTDGNLSNASWQFSPDAREILLTTKNGVFLLDAGSFTPQNQRVNVASKKEEILARWEKERQTKFESLLKRLPDEVAEILKYKASNVVFSPDKTKVLYTASESAVLSKNLIKPVPGASTQKQERNIKPGRTYIYDIKEDRNFLISEEPKTLSWFPTSRHLILAEENKITILDYDGTNRQVVYSGSYVAPYAFPTASTENLLILTNLGADSVTPNLYSLSLK